MPPEKPQAADRQPTLQERWNMLTDDLQIQVIDTTDEITARFYEELQFALYDRPIVHDTVEELLVALPQRNTRFISELLPRLFTAMEIEYDLDYPAGRNHSGSWTPAFERLEDNIIRAKFLLNKSRPIQSNIAERGKLLLFELMLHGIDNDVIVLEDGSSGNQIGKKAALLHAANLEYQPTKVMERRRMGAANRIIENPYFSQRFNSLVNQPFDLSCVVGLDLFKPTDPAVKAWRKACSHYLIELLDENKRREFDYLEEANPENVTWQFADFTSYTKDDYHHDFPGKRLPDAVYIPFSLYLVSPEEQKSSLDNAVDIVNRSDNGGIVAILDDIQSINATNQPKIVQRKRDYSTCGLWVYDSKHPEAGFQKHMSVKSGRCEAVIYEPALGNMMVQAALNS